MAKIKFPRVEVEKHIKLDSQTLDKISMFGTLVESISENELELEISANRPDLMSLHGFIRAFSIFQGKLAGKEYKPKKSGYKLEINSSVSTIRPHIVSAVVKGLDLSDSQLKEIINLQEKLAGTIGRQRKKIAIGIYPLKKIEFPITYKALNPGSISFIPLGSQKQMSAQQILEKHPTGKEYGHILSRLAKYPVLVDSANKILSMPPIVNSNETGRVSPHDSELFIECSGWNKDLLNKTLVIIVAALADMGGTIYEVVSDKESYPNFSPSKRKISIENVNKKLGLNLGEKEISKLLSKMGHSYSNKIVQTPAWRVDILDEVDLIEDIAIAYGYDNFPSHVPALATIASEPKENEMRRKISEMLIGLGMLETSSLHFVTQDELAKLAIESIAIDSPKTEYTHLRPNLLIPTMRTLSRNTDNEYPQKIFEIGTTFSKREEEHLAIALTPGNSADAKQIVDYISRMLDVKLTTEQEKVEGFIEGRTASIMLDNKKIGYFGELHPNVLKDWRLKMPMSFIELNIEEIYKKLV